MPLIEGTLHNYWKAGKERYKAQIAADKIKFKSDLGPELDKITTLSRESFKVINDTAKHTQARAKIKMQAQKCLAICNEYTTTLAGLKDSTASGGLKNRLKNISDALKEYLV
jgi:hypothetical protein